MQAQTQTEDLHLDQMVSAFLSEGATLKDARGLSDDDMNAIYHLGFSLYNNQKYEDAHQVFTFLNFYDHLEHKYAMGLGACRQMMKNYEGAAQAYGQASLLDAHDPRALLNAAECFLAMESAEDARGALEAALAWAEDDPRWQAERKRIHAMLAMLSPVEEKQEVEV